MSEPFLERLNRFTPDAGGLDRDALLFAAGRSSVHPNRGLAALVGLLAGTQALSLLLLWPQSPPNASRSTNAAGIATAPADLPTQSPSDTYANHDLWSARENLRKVETEDRPLSDVSFIDAGPPLRAFAPPSPSFVN
jgi:hypothetical protein